MRKKTGLERDENILSTRVSKNYIIKKKKKRATLWSHRFYLAKTHFLGSIVSKKTMKENIKMYFKYEVHFFKYEIFS